MACAQAEDDDLLLSVEGVDRVIYVWAGHVCEDCPTCLAQGPSCHPFNFAVGPYHLLCSAL